MNTFDFLKKLKDKVEEQDSRGRVTEEYFLNEEGKMYGKYIQYNHYGKEKTVSFYKNGIMQGTAKVYSMDSGFIKEEYEVKDGVTQGKYIKYYDNEKPSFSGNRKLIRRKIYKHGDFKSYYENGNLHREGTFSVGKYFKDFKEYSEDGKLVKDFTFKRGGVKVGRQYEYAYPSKNKRVSHISFHTGDNTIANGRRNRTWLFDYNNIVGNVLRNLYKNRDKWVKIDLGSVDKKRFEYKNMIIDIRKKGSTLYMEYTIKSNNFVIFSVSRSNSYYY